MSGCPKHVTFTFHGFENYSFSEMPKGELLRLGVNPYNGLVVMAYNRSNKGFEIADKLINQLYHEKSRIAETCGVVGMEGLVRMLEGDVDIKRAYEEATRREIERRLISALDMLEYKTIDGRKAV